MAMVSRLSRPVNLSSPRNPASGRFAPLADPCAITTVVIPGGLVGHRVGASDMIFADRGAAERFAVIRARKIAREAAISPPFGLLAAPPLSSRNDIRRACIGLAFVGGDDDDIDGPDDDALEAMASESRGRDLFSAGLLPC